MIERSVNLFTVNSMQSLDQLSFQYSNKVRIDDSGTSLDQRLRIFENDKKTRSGSIE